MPIEAPGALRTFRFETKQVQEHRLRFYSERIVANGKPYTVQVAATMDEAFEALDWFRIMLVFAAPVLLAAASAGG